MLDKKILFSNNIYPSLAHNNKSFSIFKKGLTYSLNETKNFLNQVKLKILQNNFGTVNNGFSRLTNKFMTICVLTQARENSTRLPYKILKNINKRHNSITLLNKRLSFSKNINKNIFIVPETDSILIDFLRKKNINYEIGSESDLISRHLSTAYKLNIETIIRITSDCPLVDFRLLDKAIELFNNTKHEEDFIYISNHTPPENSDFPNGSDIEIFSTKCLTYINQKYKDKKTESMLLFLCGMEEKKKKLSILS